MPKPKKTPDDIRKQITKTMVDAIKKGTPPWRKPWSSASNVGLPCNFQSKRKYTGINPLILMWISMLNGYTAKFWGSSSAWLKTLGVHVRKDEWAAAITLFRMLPKKDPKTGKVAKNKKGEDILFPMLREFPVFNVEQVQAPAIEVLLDGRCKAGGGGIVKALLGKTDRKARPAVTTKAELLKIAEKYLLPSEQPKKTWSRDQIAEAIHKGIGFKLRSYLPVGAEQNDEPDFEPAEAFIKATGCDLRFGGQRAFWESKADYVKVPPKRTFESMSDFYETVFHELIHWTQKSGRVGVKHQLVNDHQYAFNELVAEIGACLLLCELHVPLAEEMVEKSTGYVKSWLARMDDDPKYIFDAATQAGKAVDYLLTFIGRQNPIYEDTTSEETAAKTDRAVA